MAGYTYQERIGALFLAALATGAYLCTLVYCLRWLSFSDQGWKLRKPIDRTSLTIALMLFALSSIHITLAAVTTVEWAEYAVSRFVPNSSKLPWSATVMCTVTNTSVLITDGFLIYRCWLICAKSLRSILFPSVFWVGGLVCTILQIYWQVVKSADIAGVWVPVNITIGPGTVLTPFWASTIVVNIYTTARIVYRIWKAVKIQRNVRSSTRDLDFIARVLFDSGMVYLIVTIPHFIVWWTPNSSAAILVLGWINLPVLCSTFNLIVIRTSQYRAEGDQEWHTEGESNRRFREELSGTTISVVTISN
ncbi:hypothetical protein HYPSUDRAFT_87628 [Hypholoma sublateritium FD-334 SS-4]|uniref:G-protein coupled receptors family 1 profile domain-containing protein n=1 Tax=Hypholoma sublateritium (strain FD-334 SS-4) TaxID=945553 RepID=A0A0D2NTN9_HYPSF|nr:hypothetical protein HYPSUDRAFT_87628 [Hypholoma sublateritium FD-334 SS-4]